ADMFGIRFEGHPQPVKLLLSEPFEGHPLRKDFALMTREAKPWPGAVEGEDASGLGTAVAPLRLGGVVSETVPAFWR
ncbi:MAG: NADH-quinone oxidoreductase subunit C, partial [Bauldia sp.]